ncbi:Putative N-acetylglucosamine kinase [Ignavibacterium album JCM 16511]|uniref:Putative N-acetylglucosamine kinase n=1 Tax=Ignavibacterium album (strain DSM 19864 / JCM 16511 / NBRC 101810 / Mat9-16) TaxID=945713 RepID=I0AI83_IGNAJ|nr:BadF/BadG/BcrA/BcrD ATPase family protein [Ignavibacterium album]AFH48690.1 Putative N-acetylglucosamine kinase [Ignavibacterium album JCM 16511]
MKYLIGIDGGGTKSKCVITDFELNPLYEVTGGPSNFLMLGTDKVAETILSLIIQCVNHLNINYENISSIVLGTTGGGRRNDAEELERAITHLAAHKRIPLKDFHVESDARIALEGAFSGKPGSILIAGTGSIMFGKDRSGNIHRVGGFGRFIGDEGGGFRLGQKGLRFVAKEFDGRASKTLMTALLKEKFKIDSPENLITEIYRNNFDIASVAPLVIEAAEKGDKPAQTIIESEADELILHIDSMRKKLKEKKFYLALIGSLITTENYYSFRFREKVVQKFDDVIIKDAENPPEIGAAIMARQIAQ